MATFKKNIRLNQIDPLFGTVDFRNGSVTTEKIADGAITSEKIANGAITEEKIKDSSLKLYDERISDLEDAQKYDFNGVETTTGASSIEIKLTSDDDSQSVFLDSASTTAAGLMTATDKSKLDIVTKTSNTTAIKDSNISIGSPYSSSGWANVSAYSVGVLQLDASKGSNFSQISMSYGNININASNSVCIGGKAIVTEAPEDGKTYGRKDGAWTEVTGGGITEKELNDSAGDISLVSLEEFAEALYLSETDVPAFFETPYDRVKVCGYTLSMQCDYTRYNSQDQEEHHIVYGSKNSSLGIGAMADFFTTDVDGETMYSFVLDK